MTEAKPPTAAEIRRARQRTAEQRVSDTLRSLGNNGVVQAAPDQGGPTVWVYMPPQGDAPAGWVRYFVRLTEVSA